MVEKRVYDYRTLISISEKGKKGLNFPASVELLESDPPFSPSGVLFESSPRLTGCVPPHYIWSFRLIFCPEYSPSDVFSFLENIGLKQKQGPYRIVVLFTTDKKIKRATGRTSRASLSYRHLIKEVYLTQFKPSGPMCDIRFKTTTCDKTGNSNIQIEANMTTRDKEGWKEGMEIKQIPCSFPAIKPYK